MRWLPREREGRIVPERRVFRTRECLGVWLSRKGRGRGRAWSLGTRLRLSPGNARASCPLPGGGSGHVLLRRVDPVRGMGRAGSKRTFGFPRAAAEAGQSLGAEPGRTAGRAAPPSGLRPRPPGSGPAHAGLRPGELALRSLQSVGPGDPGSGVATARDACQAPLSRRPRGPDPGRSAVLTWFPSLPHCHNAKPQRARVLPGTRISVPRARGTAESQVCGARFSQPRKLLK